MIHYVSAAILATLVAGWAVRRNKPVHVTVMLVAFVLDISLLLYVELTRQAIKTAFAPPTWLVAVHILISLGVLAAYGAQLTAGFRALNGHSMSRRFHMTVGAGLIGLRLLNFVTGLKVSGEVHPERAALEHSASR